jgi:NAD dependent epimerase/dehydratase
MLSNCLNRETKMKIIGLEKQYKDKRVGVTGAGGFIGSHLVEELVRNGAQVRALVHYNSSGLDGWLEESKYRGEVEIIRGDVRDPFQCDRFVKDSELIFNLAALIGIPYSYEAPASYLETNLTGALNIVESIRRRCNCRLVQMSTSEVYGSARNIPMNEEHALQAQSPYSASKIAADALVLSYNRSFEVDVVVGRPFNTYGPRQSRRAVIPAIINQLNEGGGTLKLGNLDAIRDFCFVEDTCRLLMMIGLSDMAVGRAVNIGTGVGISIRDLAGVIRSIMDIQGETEVEKERVRPINSEVSRLICDNSLLKQFIGEFETASLDKGLKETISWNLDQKPVGRAKRATYFV